MDYYLNKLLLPGTLEKLQKNPDALSKGEKHLVYLCRAICCDSDIFIFDELTSDLDSASEIKIRDIVRTELKDKTCIFVTHVLHSLPG